MQRTKEALKICLLLLALGVGVRVLTLTRDLERSVPIAMRESAGGYTKALAAQLQPTLDQTNATLASISALTGSLAMLSADLDKELPKLDAAAAIETQAINAKLDTLNDSAAQLAAIASETKPLLDETTKTIHDLHPQLLGTVAASKVAAGEVAQTMKTVRDTVQAEAAPTAKALRGSAEGTAGTTQATAQLLNHVDDALFGKKTLKQKIKSWIMIIAGLAVRTSPAW